MKRTLTALTASGASAFDPKDKQKLKDTNECVECDLTGAKLDHEWCILRLSDTVASLTTWVKLDVLRARDYLLMSGVTPVSEFFSDLISE